METRGDHPGVVEHEHVAWGEQLGQVAHDAVFESRPEPLARMNDEEPRGVARLGRAQRDALVRQLEVEIVDAHHPPRGRRRLVPPHARAVKAPTSRDGSQGLKTPWAGAGLEGRSQR